MQYIKLLQNEHNWYIHQPYKDAAYLFSKFIYQLPSTLEKVITEYKGKHQYGAYVAQAIKQLAGYHELPYSFILKNRFTYGMELYISAPDSVTSR